MKQGIHPDYQECKVTCACGETFATRSVKPTLRVEICTGAQKIVYTEGRFERFIKRYKLQERYGEKQ
jgi:large subunit ribosomal protein L31